MHVSLFVGTKRGLFILQADASRAVWRIAGPLLIGREVYHVAHDARHDVLYAATGHSVWGAHVFRSADGGATWDVLANAPHHADGRGVEAVWFIAPADARHPARLYAGIEPAGLFVSDDAGATWHAVRSLNEHPTAATWQPAGGALALHSIAHDPRQQGRLFCAVSAGGAYRSDDDGASWQPINSGVRAEFLPRTLPEAGQCVHRMLLHARTSRLYQQNHCGVYRSDDAGDSWIEITGDLPSDFGYALALDPHDEDTLFVVPEQSSEMRTVVDGRLRVYRSRDAGGSWQALTRGLPQSSAWISILREGLTSDTLDPAGLYVGTSSGHVFATRDGGDSWHVVAEFLPRVLSLSAVVYDATA